VMKKFFSQFGTVSRINAPVTKAGFLRGHAFIEFEDPVVAQVVSDTMDGYILFKNVMKCKVAKPSAAWTAFKPTNVIEKNKISKSQITRSNTTKQSVFSADKDLSTLNKRELQCLQSFVEREKKSRSRCLKLGITYKYKPLSKSTPKKKVQRK